MAVVPLDAIKIICNRCKRPVLSHPATLSICKSIAEENNVCDTGKSKQPLQPAFSFQNWDEEKKMADAIFRDVRSAAGWI